MGGMAQVPPAFTTATSITATGSGLMGSGDLETETAPDEDKVSEA